MIQAEHITKTFHGFKALDDMSLHVPKGIYRPDCGSILIDGLPVYDNPEAKAKFTYIPDDLFYFLQADTLEMKRFYQGIYQNFDTALFNRLQEFFPTIDTRRNIRRLSKGMQKQVAFWLLNTASISLVFYTYCIYFIFIFCYIYIFYRFCHRFWL